MTWSGCEINHVELRYVISGILSTNEVSGVNRYYVAVYILYCRFYIYNMVNLFMFLGNWDILTLLVIADIFFFIIVTLGGLNVIYGVIFLLVLDLVVCIYVIYL